MRSYFGTRKLGWVIFLQLQLQGIYSLSPLWDSVTTNIYQEYDVQEGDDILTVRVNMGEYTSTDLVVGEDIRKDARLILTCIANHGPADWVYSGDGNPNFVKNSTTENGKRLPINDMNGAKTYIATLTLGQAGITTKDTGRYNCMTASPETGMKYKTLSAFYHVYVPAKQKLFIRKSETVYYDLNKSAARIPCGVSNPKASVTLQKFEQENLEFIPNDGILFHPISGYYPKKDIKGTYICTAAFNNTFDFVYFTLTPDLEYQNNQRVSKRPSKKPSRHTKPDEMEWLMYPSVTTKRSKITPHKPTTTPVAYTNSVLTTKRTNLSSYVPFHLRYTTTTYGPFQTFYTVQTTPQSTFFKTRPTVKTNPFNPDNYPSELFTQSKPTRRPSSNSGTVHETHENDLPFPEELISYRPILNHVNNKLDHRKPNQTTFQIFNSKKPTPPIVIEERTTTRYSMRNTRTTPRKYRPYTIPTTQMPIIIPEEVICSQFSCGINAVCFASMVYNRTLKILNAEPGCKCFPNHLGNPYSECYPPTVKIDPNLLIFNLSAFGRSPLLEDPIYSNSESESGSSITDSGSNDEEKHSSKTTSVDIIDM